MQRDDYFRERKIPLMIGGATTSRVHTAVKIAPNYDGPVVYTPDASRAVSVAANLVSDQVDTYVAGVAQEYEEVRRRHANRKATPLMPLAEARAARPATDWTAYVPPKPKYLGRRDFKSYDLAEIARYLDWGPFFNTWGLFGHFPAILQDKVVGEQASKVYEEGQAMLKKIIEGRWLKANGVVGFYPANTVNDEDIEVYKDESRSEVLFTWRNLRQQGVKREGVSNKCLADYIAPKSSGVADYIGVFAVTSGLGIEHKEAEFLAAQDDYSAIMLKSLADRLAEAFAECLHARVRQDLWGYALDETLSNDEMIAEKYRGIRPAPGYPACPEHVVKAEMFRVLDAEEIGMHITEGYAMMPASSVSGFYFSHPDSQYFNVGVIGADQVADYVARSGRTEEEVRRSLAPNLG
jgi:5-methyltetrahydrofolate--homocysteine methyltransferase